MDYIVSSFPQSGQSSKDVVAIVVQVPFNIPQILKLNCLFSCLTKSSPKAELPQNDTVVEGVLMNNKGGGWIPFHFLLPWNAHGELEVCIKKKKNKNTEFSQKMT